MILRRAFLVAMACGMAANAFAQSNPPLKLGAIMDMAGLYADSAGEASIAAARMAIEDFGGEVLGRKIELLTADHQNKADIASNIAREWFDNQRVEALIDVAASATALAANEIAKSRGKIIILNAPGTNRLTNEACGPYTVHYNYDTFALANGTGSAAVKQGLDSWFFLTADYAFGHDMEKDASNVVKASGGKMLGSIKHPLNSSDFSSFLLQAQASGAKVIGLANAGSDTTNAIKQAVEFGITKNQRLVTFLVFITDIDTLSLQTAQGLLLTASFYWDLNDETRAFARRFNAKVGRMPDMNHASIYSATMTYLKAVKATNSTDSAAVIAEMKSAPINDMFARNGRIREDGRMVHDLYLFEVKSPAESKQRWDYYKVLATIPGNSAFQPLSLSRCPLVKN